MPQRARERFLKEVEIVPFKIKHIEEVREMHFLVPDGWSMKGLISDIANTSTQSFVAIYQGKAIGFCSYIIQDDAELVFLCTHPSHQKKGIASYLLKTTIANLPVNTVVLEVRSENTTAINLYKKLGFEKLGIRKNFYSYPSDDAVVMEFNKEYKLP